MHPFALLQRCGIPCHCATHCPSPAGPLTVVSPQTGVPLALSISPLAELPEAERPPPVVDLGPLGPVRCIRCKAYMCPFMTFIDGGRRFSCPFCKASTEGQPGACLGVRGES